MSAAATCRCTSDRRCRAVVRDVILVHAVLRLIQGVALASPQLHVPEAALVDEGHVGLVGRDDVVERCVLMGGEGGGGVGGVWGVG